ncbi:MAG: transglutaminase domain-containing protein [Anaerotardibacter sp.]
MKKFSFRFRTEINFSSSVTDHDFVLRCVPPSTPKQRVKCTLELDPEVPFDMQVDNFGNPLAVGCIREPHDSFFYEVTGTATIDNSGCRASEAHPIYKFPSPLTVMSDEMLEYLAQCASEIARYRIKRGMGAHSSPLFTCEYLMHKVHEKMEYVVGSTTVKTTAQEAFAQAKGVCQDFSHVLIALVRESGIPARYVSGLSLGEGATHAWVEAYIDGNWVGFDSTRDCMTDESYLVLSTGRDWADCPVERGTFQGFADQSQLVFAQMKEVGAQ